VRRNSQSLFVLSDLPGLSSFEKCVVYVILSQSEKCVVYVILSQRVPILPCSCHAVSAKNMVDTETSEVSNGESDLEGYIKFYSTQ
jgi:hypothetical protein